MLLDRALIWVPHLNATTVPPRRCPSIQIVPKQSWKLVCVWVPRC